MNAQVYLALFTLVACLGAGLAGFQGALALRYRSERLNKASAVVAGALALAAIALFAMRLGQPQRLFSGFANLTSGITLALYATLVFVVACVVIVAMSSRAEDASVPAWCGWLGVVASLVLVAGVTCGYLLSAKLEGELFATCALMLGGALVLGCSAHLLLASALGDADAMGQGRVALLASAVLAGVGIAAYLVWFSQDTQAAATATKSALSMSTYTMSSTVTTTATDSLAVIMSGESALLFWAGAVGCGVAVPAACGVAALACGRTKGADGSEASSYRRGLLVALSLVSLLAALGGGYAIRACLAVLG